MCGLPLFTIASVGSTVLVAVILLILWGLYYKGAVQ